MPGNAALSNTGSTTAILEVQPEAPSIWEHDRPGNQNNAISTINWAAPRRLAP
jgi:hypothetical protein